MKPWPIALLSLATASSALAQKPMSPAVIHDRIVAIITDRAPSIALAGDTTVTWYHGAPILYHVVHLEPSSSQSLFLRNDSLVGLARVTWDSAGPLSFSVVWLAADSVAIRVDGERNGGLLRITGSRDTTLQVPTLPWAIADYGMEENVVPAIRRLGPFAHAQSIAVYRPFGGKWDTLSVVTSAGKDGSLQARESEGEHPGTWVIDGDGALLQFTHLGERRPLETTRRFAAYQRLRVPYKDPQ